MRLARMRKHHEESAEKSKVAMSNTGVHDVLLHYLINSIIVVRLRLLGTVSSEYQTSLRAALGRLCSQK